MATKRRPTKEMEMLMIEGYRRWAEDDLAIARDFEEAEDDVDDE